MAKMLLSEVYQQTTSHSESTDLPTSPTKSSDDSMVLVNPSSSINSYTSLKASPIVNPLLAAGLVPKNLSDILDFNESASVAQRIIKARVVMEENITRHC